MFSLKKPRKTTMYLVFLFAVKVSLFAIVDSAQVEVGEKTSASVEKIEDGITECIRARTEEEEREEEERRHRESLYKDGQAFYFPSWAKLWMPAVKFGVFNFRVFDNDFQQEVATIERNI